MKAKYGRSEDRRALGFTTKNRKSHPEESLLEVELLQLKDRFEIAPCKNYRKRVCLLEKFLYDLFCSVTWSLRQAIKIMENRSTALFVLGNAYALFEAISNKEVHRNDLADFCHKVDTKLKSALGLLVSVDGVTRHAIDPYFKSVIVMDGFDVMSTRGIESPSVICS